MWETILSNLAQFADVIWIALGSFLLLLVNRIMGKWKETELGRAIYEALEAGVAQTNEQFVEWKKRAAADGKLTKEERAEARHIAITAAVNIARDQRVKTELLGLGEERLMMLINRILEKK